MTESLACAVTCDRPNCSIVSKWCGSKIDEWDDARIFIPFKFIWCFDFTDTLNNLMLILIFDTDSGSQSKCEHWVLRAVTGMIRKNAFRPITTGTNLNFRCWIVRRQNNLQRELNVMACFALFPDRHEIWTSVRCENVWACFVHSELTLIRRF